MMNAENQREPSVRRNADLRRRIITAICGACLAIFCLFVGISFLVSRNQMPVLTRESFDAAEAKWNSVAVQGYTIATRVEGNQPATYQVRVVDGKVQQALRNDYPLQDQRTLGTWSVPGMFRTIERDLENTERPPNALQRAGGLHLRAEFDPKWGYPRRYLRVEWGQSNQVNWEVVRFEVAGTSESFPSSERVVPE